MQASSEMKIGRYACIGIAALAWAVVGTLALVFYGHPEHAVRVECESEFAVACYKIPNVVSALDVEVQEPIPHRPVQEYEVD